MNRSEFAIRRYEAKMGIWKVLLGTTVVGLAAAALPFLIQIVEQSRLEDKEYRSFVAAYVDKGISQNIELRIRFAQYFKYISDGGEVAIFEKERADISKVTESDRWSNYYNELVEIRQSGRKKINDLEEKRARIIADTPDLGKLDLDKQIQLNKINRELKWAYAEIGYIQVNTSVAQRQELIPGSHWVLLGSDITLNEARLTVAGSLKGRPIIFIKKNSVYRIAQAANSLEEAEIIRSKLPDAVQKRGPYIVKRNDWCPRVVPSKEDEELIECLAKE